MTIDNLQKIWSFYSFPDLNHYLQEQPATAIFDGLYGSSDAFFIVDLFQKTKETVLVLVENSKKAEVLAEECRSLINPDFVFLFPSRDAVPYNSKSPFGPTVESRFNVLHALMNGEKGIIIAPAVALLQQLPPQRTLFKQLIPLHCNDEITIDELSTWLIHNGFHRENQASDIGMFSVRGGIVDIYPLLSEHPIRIEFWGNTIDSIRKFDVFSQKSLDHLKAITIFPMREFLLSGKNITSAVEAIKAHCTSQNIDFAGIDKLEHQWRSGDVEGIEWFFHWFDFKSVSLFDYLPSTTRIVWDDIVTPEQRFDEGRKNYDRHRERAAALFLPLLSPALSLLFDDVYINNAISCFSSLFINTKGLSRDIRVFQQSFLDQPFLPKEIDAIVRSVTANVDKSMRCVLVSPNLGHAERLIDLLGEHASFFHILIGSLSHGFIDNKNKLAVYAESQLLHQAKISFKGKKRSKSYPLSKFEELTPDDYIVHEDHGIAKFLGIEHISAGDIKQDCMVLLYADNTKIYVPVGDFHKVQKYIGKDSDAPQLSKIGTASWEKLKQKTRESIQAMAEELIELYAKRQHFEGNKCNPDTVWQKEFEDAFIYDETEDQLRVTSEIKVDMESGKPMDRLVCGDVGFGKTEVAMRTAFKAVMSGFQVAILAPTTILAAQHFTTFSDRMRDFPVKLTVLSRFVKPHEIKERIEAIKNGKVDIVIGTHRVLSKDVEFKNIGLLIIDEEQRFGVHHKEKIQQYRYKVDVLSLTATPIPRTLQLSLIGARDLSIISTPPRNRLPIETLVTPYHDEQLRNSVENELDRGGQVYFVNNRIKNLELIRDIIERLVPRARVIIAHGQMDEELLENIMKEFIAGRYDILLSTVIIENGLDIPNVNTIIVNRADSLGLSQLYQLRGRVGRSSEQAYAVFFTPPFNQLTDVALKRLKALEQYTELGSGFQIAMRDLEIRGAGNILGTRQHGFIEAIGFELYCRILQEAIDEVQDTKPSVIVSEVKIDIPLEAYIPKEYISDGPTRISIYQELSSCADLASLAEDEQMLLDRFGPMPEVVIALLTIIRLKIAARLLLIHHIVLTQQKPVQLFFSGDDTVIRQNVSRFFAFNNYSFEIENSSPVSLKMQMASFSLYEKTIELAKLISSITEKMSDNPLQPALLDV